MAFSVPHFSLFLNIVGAVACSMLAFMCPVIFFNKLYRGTDVLTKNKKIIHGAVIVFGILGSITSLVVTLIELVRVSSESNE